jgi:hypothetical protein
VTHWTNGLQDSLSIICLLRPSGTNASRQTWRFTTHWIVNTRQPGCYGWVIVQDFSRPTFLCYNIGSVR